MHFINFSLDLPQSRIKWNAKKEERWRAKKFFNLFRDFLACAFNSKIKFYLIAERWKSYLTAKAKDREEFFYLFENFLD